MFALSAMLKWEFLNGHNKTFLAHFDADGDDADLNDWRFPFSREVALKVHPCHGPRCHQLQHVWKSLSLSLSTPPPLGHQLLIVQACTIFDPIVICADPPRTEKTQINNEFCCLPRTAKKQGGYPSLGRPQYMTAFSLMVAGWTAHPLSPYLRFPSSLFSMVVKNGLFWTTTARLKYSEPNAMQSVCSK